MPCYEIIIKDSKDSDEKFLKSFYGKGKIGIIFDSAKKPSEDEEVNRVLQSLWDLFSEVFGEDMSESKLGYIYGCIDYNKAKIYKEN